MCIGVFQQPLTLGDFLLFCVQSSGFLPGGHFRVCLSYSLHNGWAHLDFSKWLQIRWFMDNGESGATAAAGNSVEIIKNLGKKKKINQDKLVADPVL